MTFIHKWLHRKVEKERSNTVIEDYGGIIFWFGIVGATILGLLAAGADGFVLYGIFYSGTSEFWLAVFWAVIGSLAIQFFMSGPFIVAYKAYYTEDAWELNLAPIMYVSAAICVLSFGVSTWLSLQPKPMIEGLAEKNMVLDDPNAIRQHYVKLEQEGLAAIDKQIAELRADNEHQKKQFVTENGKRVRSWPSRRAEEANTLAIEELQRQRGELRRSMAKEREEAVKMAAAANTEVKTRTAARVEKTSNGFKGFSIISNLLRLLAIWVLTRFLLVCRKIDIKKGTVKTGGIPGFEFKTPGQMVGSGQQNTYSGSQMQIPIGTNKQASTMQTNTVQRMQTTGGKQMQAPPKTTGRKQRKQAVTNGESSANSKQENEPRKQSETDSENESFANKSAKDANKIDNISVTVFNGEPTVPYKRRNGDVVQWTLRDVRNNINARKRGGNPGPSDKKALKKLRKMEAVLVKAKKEMRKAALEA